MAGVGVVVVVGVVSESGRGEWVCFGLVGGDVVHEMVVRNKLGGIGIVLRWGSQGITRYHQARQYMYKFQQASCHQASSGDVAQRSMDGGAESVIWAPRKPSSGRAWVRVQVEVAGSGARDLLPPVRTSTCCSGTK